MNLSRYYSLSTVLLLAFLVLGFLLRFIWLDQIPPGFNWDEASVGYNAYSLAQTGKDEYGKPWPIIIEAFGEHKIGLYSIMIAPLIKLWGLSVFTVRFPNVIFGTLLILTSYWLARRFFKDPLPATLVAGLMAISPWAIQTSRFTLEWYFGMPATVAAITLLLKAQKQSRLLLLSALFFAVGLYSYHSLRVFIPLFLITFCIVFRRTLAKHKKVVAAGFTSLGAGNQPNAILFSSPGGFPLPR
jgi:4-amino-4-deoxy-L-arabinose transferase-like glycosyltransferase